jgi:hypothetical protein
MNAQALLDHAPYSQELHQHLSATDWWACDVAAGDQAADDAEHAAEKNAENGWLRHAEGGWDTSGAYAADSFRVGAF